MSELVLFHQFLKPAIVTLGAIGLHIIPNGENFKISFGFRYLFLLTITVLFILSEMKAALILYHSSESGDLFEIVFASISFSYRSVGSIKSLLFLSSRSTVTEVLSRYQEIFPKSRDQQKYFHVEKYFDFTSKFLRIFSIIPLLLGAFVVLICTTTLISGFYTTGKLVLFFEAWYPFDSSDPKYFLFCYIQQCITTLFTLATIFGFEFMMVAFIMLMKMNFNRLCEDFDESPKYINYQIERHIYLTKFVFIFL